MILHVVVTTPGRVEARITVPSGGAAFSASNGAQSAASALTLPGGDYFLTAAGGVSGLCSTLQSYLNDNVQGYPTVAAAMQAALGYGNWTSGAGWLFNIASGNDAGTFGGVTMTTSGSVTYGVTGPRSGIDKAVNFDGSTARFDAGNTFDVSGTDDLIVAWVGRFTGDATANGAICGRLEAGFAAGWSIESTSTSNLRFRAGAGASVDSTISNLLTNEWHVGIAYCDRSGNVHRLGIQGLTSGTQVLGTSGTPGSTTYAATANFRAGACVSVSQDNHDLAALYVVEGSGIATGLNLSTALTNFANAINATWSVSFDTSSGRATISNSFWPSSVAFTNTTLRDVLGFEYDFDYPATPAQLTAALGGLGNWVAGSAWLCNESSGNLAPVFGSTTLTAVSSPTYSNIGARGGNDKSIGFDSVADAFNGGDVNDIDASGDLILLWVGYVSARSGNRDMFSKWSANPGWFLLQDDTAGTFRLQLRDGSLDLPVSSTAITLREPYIGMAVVDRGAARARVGTLSLLTGTSTVGAEVNITGLATLANAASFIMGAGSITGAGPETNSKVSYLACVTGTGVAAGLSANLSTALSSFRSYMLGQTGTQHCRGLWIPDSLFDIDGDPRMAPKVTDKRDTESPTGVTYSLRSTYKREHRRPHWSHVTIDHVREASAPYAHGSWEWFLDETQFGLGASWFSPGSLIQIYDHNGDRVGQDANVAGWAIHDVDAFEDTAALVIPGYTGLWDIHIPRLVAEGG